MIPVLILIAATALVAWLVIDAIRISRRPLSPQDGCVACGAAECDVLVGHGRGEGYCWPCIDTWPADGVPLARLGLTVFPGRERSAR